MIRFLIRPVQTSPRQRPARHAALAALSIGAGLVLALAGTGTALGITACRSDPVVTLSDGTTLTVWESISDTASDVKSISYAVHVPVGVSIKSVVYTGDVAAQLQSVTLYADENSGDYDTYTTVVTGTPGIQTKAYAQANNSTAKVVSAQTTGHTPNPLHNHLYLKLK
jgi:hypothetical protein